MRGSVYLAARKIRKSNIKTGGSGKLNVAWRQRGGAQYENRPRQQLRRGQAASKRLRHSKCFLPSAPAAAGVARVKPCILRRAHETHLHASAKAAKFPKIISMAALFNLTKSPSKIKQARNYQKKKTRNAAVLGGTNVALEINRQNDEKRQITPQSMQKTAARRKEEGRRLLEGDQSFPLTTEGEGSPAAGRNSSFGKAQKEELLFPTFHSTHVTKENKPAEKKK